MATLSNTQGLNIAQSAGQSITVSGISSTGGLTTLTIPSTSTNAQWMPTRLKLEPGVANTSTANLVQTNVMNTHNVANTVAVSSSSVNAQALTLDCYEDMFKEITKKLYGTEDALALMTDATDHPTNAGSIIYDPEAFRTDQSGAITFINTNGLPPGTIVIQRRIQDEKAVQPGEQLTLATVSNTQTVMEERWFESDTVLNWTTSKIARYNPNQKVFRCVDCDFVGFLSRVAEHWLGNHASLRVFQCPRCPYTSAWARCVRMHLTRQHGEALTDNSLWKENPVLEEVTKFLNSLKTRVEQKADTSSPGEKRYLCQYCSYSTDRRDLFNRHENIHRDEKPFQCFVCEKQFNRADHVKKHFTRMHREHTYDINRIRKHIPKPATTVTGTGVSIYQATKYVKQETQAQHQIVQIHDPAAGTTSEAVIQIQSVSGGSDGITLQQIPQIAYFNPTQASPQPGAAQGMQGVGGDKKATKTTKSKGQKKKKQGEKMYTCSYCPWQGVDNWCLKRHLNTHIKPFLCALCDYKAARSERLATHVLKVHNKRVCHKCSFLADDPESLAQHVQDSHQNPLVKTGYNCNLCQEYFELRADLEAHAILEHQKVIVQCDLCDFRTTDELAMECHLRDKHNLQPGMGAVAAATAAAAAAVTIEQPQQTFSQSQVIQLPPETLSMPALQPRSVQLPPPPLLQHHSDSIVKQEDLSADMQAYHIEETISTVAAVAPELEPDVPPDTSCDFCGCEFYEEESALRHQKGHELRKAELAELQNSKVISRHYTCSTCSYNSATSRIMMQHQRTHSGFELDCKAVGCSFTTSFETSLKEHVHLDHNDETIRCPHCGYRILSLIDFTFHWKIHHSSVCSLCTGIYRIKYGMKEPDIQEFLFRTPYETLEFKKSEDEEENPLAITNLNIYPENEPLAKRPREELGSVFSSIATYFNHPSIYFLPRAIDITVISLKPPVDTISTPRPRKKIWDRKFDRRNTREKVLRYTIRRLISTSKNYSIPLLPTRRGNGVKCFQQECRFGKTTRYIRKSTLLLHHSRVHRRLRIKCDKCDAWFPYLYKAILHQLRYHPVPPTSRQIKARGSFQHHELLHHNNNNMPTRIAFKQE